MTQKEYTGPEFEIEFARAWLKYVEGGKVGADPRKEWQVHCNGDWPSKEGVMPTIHDDLKYRWKPAPKRMVTISYKTDKMALPVARTVVAAEVVAPEMGTRFYFLFNTGISEGVWVNDTVDNSWLIAGDVFLARKDAQAMADWLATCRKGGQS